MNNEDLEDKLLELVPMQKQKSYSIVILEYNVILDKLGCPYKALKGLQDYYNKYERGFLNE